VISGSLLRSISDDVLYYFDKVKKSDHCKLWSICMFELLVEVAISALDT
jgi:hypothetical protein